MKRSFILLSLPLLFITAGSFVFAAFSDVPDDSKYADAVDFLKINGVVQGYADGTFRPRDHINRYDFLKIIIESVYPDPVIKACDIDSYSFLDVPTGHWAKSYLCVGKRDGIIQGYGDGLYHGDNLVTLAESAKIVLESFEVPLVSGSFREWFEQYLATAGEKGLLDDISENPIYQIKRGDMALLVYRLDKESSASPNPEPENNNNAGAVSTPSPLSTRKPKQDERPSPSASSSDRTPTKTPKPTESPIPTPTPITGSTLSKEVIATLFWVGETADSSNGYITNVESAWVGDWMGSYGGNDAPDNRCGYKPCDFTPKENPFYYALPYNDLDENGERKASTSLIPWFESKKDRTSVVKNTWVEVEHNGNICYGQWADVGPFLEDDFDYVFGNAQPSNTFGEEAGIDLSPGFWDCLKMNDNANVKWRFIDDADVPPGPWKEIVTTSDVNW